VEFGSENRDECLGNCRRYETWHDVLAVLAVHGTNYCTRTLPSPYPNQSNHCRPIPCSVGRRVRVTIYDLYLDLGAGEGIC
jgi:hypothetical protein